jgi:hypothetical protein
MLLGLSYIVVLIWPLSSNSRYKSKNDAVSVTSSSGGYINGRNSANLELLIDKTSSIHLFVYSYEFLQKLVKYKKIHESRAFNFIYMRIEDVLSINNSRFAEFLPLIYPPELEVTETASLPWSSSLFLRWRWRFRKSE